MGHDIYGWRVRDESERDRISLEMGVDNYDSESWAKRYDEYCEKTRCAYLRRSAFDRNNRRIYEALDAMDCYAGCSGTGAEREFSLQQINAAIKRVGQMLEEPAPERERNPADALESALRGAGFTEVFRGGTDPDDDLSDELRFLQRCRAQAKRDGSVLVYFG